MKLYLKRIQSELYRRIVMKLPRKMIYYATIRGFAYLDSPIDATFSVVCKKIEEPFDKYELV